MLFPCSMVRYEGIKCFQAPFLCAVVASPNHVDDIAMLYTTGIFGRRVSPQFYKQVYTM